MAPALQGLRGFMGEIGIELIITQINIGSTMVIYSASEHMELRLWWNFDLCRERDLEEESEWYTQVGMGRKGKKVTSI